MTREEILNKYKKDKNLSRADLSGANLSGANLNWADLSGAKLNGADLSGAKLIGAINLPKEYQSCLNILKQQKGKLIAYKYLNKNWESPYQKFTYKIGETYTCEKENEDNDERILCSKGINVATLEWCYRDNFNNIEDCIIIEVEFAVKDIIAIPYNSDGKFRVRKIKVLRQIPKEELEEYFKPLYPNE